MRVQTVRLTVKWQGHGQHRIIAQCQPTRESLQSAALSDVRLHPNAFTSKAPNTASRNSNNRDSASPTLRAQVRQVVLNGEPYDMRAFHGHDLTRLFQAMTTEDSMPSFEVVVEDTYSDSDDDNDDDDDDDATVQGPSDVMKPERWD
ncbi:hypothetical protein NUW58_g2823 [Xylaria curta]|uniref:Uncharacterized protein n=1 Tax=Xylaria curta TaxID=42375 RepID=A0ACC1PDP5_9PEZI|nr:hypothetical protein NUW58_g2823 [Xylaria curta]